MRVTRESHTPPAGLSCCMRLASNLVCSSSCRFTVVDSHTTAWRNVVETCTAMRLSCCVSAWSGLLSAPLGVMVVLRIYDETAPEAHACSTATNAREGDGRRSMR